ncbi:34-kDa subunit of RNA polymerase III (C) [Microbotryomycetes sp. JL221]|nr:34-kDa subunit of RNA polymerase III (C) [Microbotryomycetes sp. JL221]
MAPTASTSKSSKLTANEAKLVKAGLAAPDCTISQVALFQACGLAQTASTAVDALNGVLRKNLATMSVLSTGEIILKFVSKDEAKAMGNMDQDERVVFDHIKDAGNSGIWTKTLTSKTGLPRTVMTKVLKTLESRKQIKPVKSVKAPTRKIYMLAHLIPSVELTGGPWFTDNELDTEFVDLLKRICLKVIDSKSHPKFKSTLSSKDPKQIDVQQQRQFLPVSAVQHLPTVEQVWQTINDSKVAVDVELQAEHVESLLELLVFDGLVERIFVDKDRATSGHFGKAKKTKTKFNNSSSSSESEQDDNNDNKLKRGIKRKAGTAKTNGKRASKKRKTTTKHKSRLNEDSDEDSDSDSEAEFDSDEEAPIKRVKDEDDSDIDGERKRTKKRRKDRSKKRRKVKDESGDSEASGGSDNSDDNDDSDDEDDEISRKPKLKLEEGQSAFSNKNKYYYVYRSLQTYKPLIGWRDMPCGHCPSEAFCWEPAQSSLSRSTTSLAKLTSVTGLRALPRVGIGMDDGMQGVGMLGGAGAAIGVSNDKWAEPKGGKGGTVAPVNPIDCRYFKEWLDF